MGGSLTSEVQLRQTTKKVFLSFQSAYLPCNACLSQAPPTIHMGSHFVSCIESAAAHCSTSANIYVCTFSSKKYNNGGSIESDDGIAMQSDHDSAVIHKPNACFKGTCTICNYY